MNEFVIIILVLLIGTKKIKFKLKTNNGSKVKEIRKDSNIFSKLITLILLKIAETTANPGKNNKNITYIIPSITSKKII
jgi:hypothetical protein